MGGSEYGVAEAGSVDLGGGRGDGAGGAGDEAGAGGDGG